MCFKVLLVAFSLSCCIQIIVSREYMTEKPAFFVPCSRLDTELNKCLKQNLAAYITNYRYGIPDYPIAGKLEPVQLRKVKLKMNQLKLEIRNITMHGLGNAEVTELVIQPQNYSLVITLQVPYIRVEANYKVDGNIIFLQFKSKGSFWMETENNTFIFHTQLQLKKSADNLVFASIVQLKSVLKHVDGFMCNVKNLFNGNEVLEIEANDLLNSNWRYLMEMAKPTIENAIDAIISTRFKKVLNFIPANYFVNDISDIIDNEFTETVEQII